MNTSIRIATLLAIGFVVIVGGTLLTFKKTATTTPTISLETKDDNKMPDAPRMPWIEIMRTQAVEHSGREGGISRILKTGDEVTIGKMIETDAQGIANVYFPDGSVLRLDSKTKVVLDQAELDSENKGMTTRIFLAAGRAWSKVLPLLTPDSLWEVKTSNAVATVRGTAFGVSITKGKTSVIGSERTVAVQAVDPETHEVVGKEVLIAPDKLVEVIEKDIPLIKQAKKELMVAVAPAKTLADPWVTNAKTEDKRHDEKIQKLKERGIEDDTKSPPALQTRPNTPTPAKKPATNTEPTNRRPETREPLSNTTPPPAPINTAPTNSSDNGAPAPVPPTGRPILNVRATQNLAQIIEGKRIVFEATLVWPNGRTQNVTSVAQWQVVGPIGKIAVPGVLAAELNPEVAEFGVAHGAIVATWKDPESGETLVGKSPIFKVEANIEDILNTDG